MVDRSQNDNSHFQGQGVAEQDGHPTDGRKFQLPGLKCGNCGERLPTVLYSEQVPGLIVRDRRCPACGHSNKTAERVISSGPVRKYFRG
jgi:hypothetical protein